MSSLENFIRRNSWTNLHNEGVNNIIQVEAFIGERFCKFIITHCP